MSWPALTWALAQKLKAPDKLVLLLLAYRVNPDSEVAEPTIDKLATECGMSRSGLKLAMQRLVDAGGQVRLGGPEGSTGDADAESGAFFAPTVLTFEDARTPEVHSVEAFGPVTSVIGYTDVADAVALAALAIALGADLLGMIGTDAPLDSTAWVPLGVFGAATLVLHVVLRLRAPYADPFMLPITALLNGLGLAMIHRLSQDAAMANPTSQLVWSVLAIVVASINIFGGFFVTRRMLTMFDGGN